MACFNYCCFCGAPTSRGSSIPGIPEATPVVIDAGNMQAHRSKVLAMMVGRRGQQLKCKVTDDFDAFLLSHSGGVHGWGEATPDYVVDFWCLRDSQGGGTKWVTQYSAWGWVLLMVTIASRPRRAQSVTQPHLRRKVLFLS